MNPYELKENGKKYRLIKKKPSAFNGMIQPEAEPRIGDVYTECKDGWYISQRSEGRVNIEFIPDKEKYYEEIKEGTTTLEVKSYVSPYFLSRDQIEHIKIEVGVNDRKKEIEKKIDDLFINWLFEQVDTYWEIKK